MVKLTIYDHSRHFRDFIYVYPVVSRRSCGLSLGINLNINNACNWRCIYCQVDGLIRAKPLAIDVAKLEAELDYLLDLILNNNFLEEFAPKQFRRFNDIALSGNGEPTLAVEILAVITIIDKLRQKYSIQSSKNNNIIKQLKTVLITNGSNIDKAYVQDALLRMSSLNGEIWFKIDSVTQEQIQQINQINLSLKQIKAGLISAANTNNKVFIQSCFFQQNGLLPDANSIIEYIDFISKMRHHLAGVMLYTIARAPALKEGACLSAVPVTFLAKLKEELSIIRNVNYFV